MNMPARWQAAANTYNTVRN